MKMLECNRRWRVWEGASALIMCQLLDAHGTPIDPSSIESMYATLYEPATSAIINSRDDQDVLASNGGQMLDNLTVAGVSQTNPVYVTTASPHGLAVDPPAQPDRPWKVRLDDIVGPTAINGRTFDVQPVTETRLALANQYGSLLPAYVSGGTVRTGMFRLQLGPLDTTIIDSTLEPGEAEEHRLVLEFEYSDGLAGQALVRIDVIRAR